MLAKYDIEYIIHPQHNKRVDTHRTDDPVEVEDFLINLLAGGARLRSIKHEGVELSERESDQMIAIAAQRLAGGLICNALSLDSAAVKHRFAFAV